MSKLNDAGVTWLILGQCTPVKTSTSPKIEWIQEIVEAADKAGIPVFLKNNLEGLLPRHGFIIPTEDDIFHRATGGISHLRQEFPK